MAISTYDELQTAIERWAAREGDTQVSGNAADFVALGKSRLNRVLPLRVNHVNTTLTGTPSSRALALPPDFVEPVALFLTTFGVQTKLKPLVAGMFEYGTTKGAPSGWCINETNIDLDVPCDQAHTFLFRYRKSFALSDGSPTNWLLTNHPDCYLAACLVEYFMFDMNEERAAAWQQRLNTAVEEIAGKDARGVAAATLSVDDAVAAGQSFNIITG